MKKIFLILCSFFVCSSVFADQPFPEGSFRETCRSDWTISGTTLTATCFNYQDQRKGGMQIISSLRNYDSCANITNNNGRLQCGAVKACTKRGSDGSGPRNGPCCGKRINEAC
jgi:hypothetical protein